MDDGLAYSAPEAQGIASTAIVSFIAAAEAQVDALHSFMLIRHGHVVAEGSWFPYAAGRHQMMFSVSKSFTSTAIGLAVADGLLSVEDPVTSFFPDIVAEPSGNLAAMRVKHLLTMTTGHAQDTTERLHERPDGDWVRAFFDRPVEHEPGTFFVYNSGASYILSAIVQRLTGVTLLDYLRPRLFEPLGITGVSWDTCPKGITIGGWGLNLRTPDLARFGQLYLNNGVWRGRQLVPAQWCAEATAAQADNDIGEAPADWRQGYGYQFWRCRHGAYRADGAFGQFCLVMPEQDAVLAITGGLSDMQRVLDLIWEHLLPAMAATALPGAGAAEQALRQRLDGLRLPAQKGKPSALASTVSGRTYTVSTATSQRSGHLPAINTITFAEYAGRWRVTIADEEGTNDYECGDGEWQLGTMTMSGWDGVTATSGGWTADDTFVMRVYLPQTPFERTCTFRFEGAGLTLAVADNVSFGPTEHPPIYATAN